MRRDWMVAYETKCVSREASWFTVFQDVPYQGFSRIPTPVLARDPANEPRFQRFIR